MPQIHFGGMISGMDIQGIIEQVLQVQVERIEGLQEEELEIQQDVAAWADINVSMSSLTEALDTLRSFDTWTGMGAASSDATALSATAGSSAAAGTYNIRVVQTAQAHMVASDSAATLGVDDSTTDLVAAGVLTAGQTFTIEGVTFTVGADEHGVTAGGTETLSSLRTKINNAADDMDNAVTASILDHRLVIARQDTGATEIAMSEPDSATGETPLQDLGIFSGDATYNAANAMLTARDAQFTVNGVTITRSANTNLTDVIENVTLNLLDETDGTFTLTISRDTATPRAAILDFVEKYNAAAAKMQSYIDVELNGSGEPDLAELQGDTLIPSVLYNMRRIATELRSSYFDDAGYSYNGASGNMDTLEDVGIWTTGTDNALELVDEDRLDYMLANYFEETEQLFRGVYESGSGYVHGVADELYDYCDSVSAPLTGAISTRMFNLEEDAGDLHDEIDEMLDDLDDQETSLWRQFGAMEEAMAQMQQELGWLTSQLGMTG